MVSQVLKVLAVFRAVGFLTTKVDSMRMQYQRAISTSE